MKPSACRPGSLSRARARELITQEYCPPVRFERYPNENQVELSNSSSKLALIGLRDEMLLLERELAATRLCLGQRQRRRGAHSCRRRRGDPLGFGINFSRQPSPRSAIAVYHSHGLRNSARSFIVTRDRPKIAALDRLDKLYRRLQVLRCCLPISLANTNLDSRKAALWPSFYNTSGYTRCPEKINITYRISHLVLGAEINYRRQSSRILNST